MGRQTLRGYEHDNTHRQLGWSVANAFNWIVRNNGALFALPEKKMDSEQEL
jgi:hypothetical protein